ncbi:sulfotransferase family 2 domain-containing protein [Desulfurivibrio dismutans]|uniref:sulfotransferase family 2 domain-containing protein n=1 Tax=Desulfurivibrio dismutans TaxID=1398908 RepID=UPI0023DB1663|nr:sulfotransferase family 2 domain-containing protein [Desulfurivibrio alkaliphilus]MDF1614763.1 sulfotransferase family 2 domain-containing protein [Desulfurivibrio alkaliphilus]
MIISHRYRFIFVHCRKVAGSSMKVSIAPHLGPTDIVLGSYQELYRDRSFFNRQALSEAVRPHGLRELASGLLRGRSWRDSLNKAVKRRYKQAFGLSSSGHPTATDIQRAFPEEWHSYFKFCFVRNPYERAVSDYLYLTRESADAPSFSNYIRNLSESKRDVHGRDKYDNWPMYTIGDQPVMDFIGRYEKLQEDFARAMERVGLPEVRLTASEKRRNYRKPWRDYYGPGDRELVGALYGKEISYFDYTFEP